MFLRFHEQSWYSVSFRNAAALLSAVHNRQSRHTVDFRKFHFLVSQQKTHPTKLIMFIKVFQNSLLDKPNDIKVNSVLKQNLDIDFVRLAHQLTATSIWLSTKLYITKRNIFVKILKLKQCMFLTNKYCIQYHFLTIRLNKKQV